MELRSTFLNISLTGDLKKEATSLENFSSYIFIYRLPVKPAMTQTSQAGNDVITVIPDLIGDLLSEHIFESDGSGGLFVTILDNHRAI